MFVCLVASHDVTRMAQLLGVSTSGYYKHRDRPRAPEPTPRIQRRRDLEVTYAADKPGLAGDKARLPEPPRKLNPRTPVTTWLPPLLPTG